MLTRRAARRGHPTVGRCLWCPLWATPPWCVQLLDFPHTPHPTHLSRSSVLGTSYLLPPSTPPIPACLTLLVLLGSHCSACLGAPASGKRREAFPLGTAEGPAEILTLRVGPWEPAFLGLPSFPSLWHCEASGCKKHDFPPRMGRGA